MSNKSRRYPPELKERAARMVFEPANRPSTRSPTDFANSPHNTRTESPSFEASPRLTAAQVLRHEMTVPAPVGISHCSSVPVRVS